jgi:hypothetical protein
MLARKFDACYITAAVIFLLFAPILDPMLLFLTVLATCLLWVGLRLLVVHNTDTGQA